MIKITKFKGIRLNTHNIKSHQAYVEVEKDGVTRSIGLPVRAVSSSSAASAGRRWRNIGDNMARLEAAFDQNLGSVPPNKEQPAAIGGNP